MKQPQKTTLNLQKYTSDVEKSSCALSSLPYLYVGFSGPSLLEMKFCRNFPPLSVLVWGCLNQLPNRTHFETVTTILTSEYVITLQTCLSLATRLCSNFSHKHTAIATSNFQTKLILRWLLLTNTHLRKRVVSGFLTHFRVRYYAADMHKLYIYTSVFCCIKCFSSRLGL